MGKGTAPHNSTCIVLLDKFDERRNFCVLFTALSAAKQNLAHDPKRSNNKHV